MTAMDDEREISDAEWLRMTDVQWLQHRVARCAAKAWTANQERYERVLNNLLSLSAEVKGLREALKDAAAHLTGAASAYRKHAARHRSQGRAASDALFSTRAADFDKAADRVRAALSPIPTQGDDQARATRSAPSSTLSKDTSK